MSYVIDRTIQSYINQERERCTALVKKLARGADKAFLLHCIEYAVQASETDERRQRFAEFPVDDDIEDLM